MSSASSTAAAEVDGGLITYTHCIYALHGLSVLMALGSSRSVALRFACSLPSIVAVIMNYARRSETRGSWLESHFRWQIHTFWYAWVWIIVTTVIAFPLVIVLVGIALWVIGLAAVGIWVIYRIVRGWLALRHGRPLPVPR